MKTVSITKAAKWISNNVGFEYQPNALRALVSRHKELCTREIAANGKMVLYMNREQLLKALSRVQKREDIIAFKETNRTDHTAIYFNPHAAKDICIEHTMKANSVIAAINTYITPRLSRMTFYNQLWVSRSDFPLSDTGKRTEYRGAPLNAFIHYMLCQTKKHRFDINGFRATNEVTESGSPYVSYKGAGFSYSGAPQTEFIAVNGRGQFAYYPNTKEATKRGLLTENQILALNKLVEWEQNVLAWLFLRVIIDNPSHELKVIEY